MDTSWFVGEGWLPVGAAGLFFAAAGGAFLWLRGPGSQPHNPPVAREGVRLFAALAAMFGALWLARALAGVGGALVLGTVLLAAALGFGVYVRRQRR